MLNMIWTSGGHSWDPSGPRGSFFYILLWRQRISSDVFSFVSAYGGNEFNEEMNKSAHSYRARQSSSVASKDSITIAIKMTK